MNYFYKFVEFVAGPSGETIYKNLLAERDWLRQNIWKLRQSLKPDDGGDSNVKVLKELIFCELTLESVSDEIKSYEQYGDFKEFAKKEN